MAEFPKPSEGIILASRLEDGRQPPCLCPPQAQSKRLKELDRPFGPRKIRVAP